MFFNEDSEKSFYIVGFLLAFSSVMTLLFVPYSNSNRQRYKFTKTVRMISLYFLMPLWVILFLLQVYGFVTGDFVTIQESLWRMVYLIGASLGMYVVWYKLKFGSEEAIKQFRRGSFNSGKFQRNYTACRNSFVLLIAVCLGILAGQFIFMSGR